jgi:hypothetical protein
VLFLGGVSFRRVLQNLHHLGGEGMRNHQFAVGDFLVDGRGVDDIAVDEYDEDAALVLRRDGIEVDLAFVVEMEMDMAGGVGFDGGEVALRDFGQGPNLDGFVVGREGDFLRLGGGQAFPIGLDVDAQKNGRRGMSGSRGDQHETKPGEEKTGPEHIRDDKTLPQKRARMLRAGFRGVRRARASVRRGLAEWRDTA